jgi:hypothetical protein
MASQAVEADFSGANLGRARLTWARMDRARLNQAKVDGARWLSVGFDRTLCPNGQHSSKPCTGFEVPVAGPAQQLALQRLTWI